MIREKQSADYFITLKLPKKIVNRQINFSGLTGLSGAKVMMSHTCSQFTHGWKDDPIGTGRSADPNKLVSYTTGPSQYSCKTSYRQPFTRNSNDNRNYLGNGNYFLFHRSSLEIGNCMKLIIHWIQKMSKRNILV